MYINHEVLVKVNKKDNQRETMTIEIVSWMIFIGIIYILSKGIF